MTISVRTDMDSFTHIALSCHLNAIKRGANISLTPSAI
jgi:hypothetical protein